MISLKMRFSYAGLTIELEKLPWHSRAALLNVVTYPRLILTTVALRRIARVHVTMDNRTTHEGFKASAAQLIKSSLIYIIHGSIVSYKKLCVYGTCAFERGSYKRRSIEETSLPNLRASKTQKYL